MNNYDVCVAISKGLKELKRLIIPVSAVNVKSAAYAAEKIIASRYHHYRCQALLVLKTGETVLAA